MKVKVSYTRKQATKNYSNAEASMECELEIDPEVQNAGQIASQLRQLCRNHVMHELGLIFSHTKLAEKTAVLPLDLAGIEVKQFGTDLPEAVQAALVAAGIDPTCLVYEVYDQSEVEQILASA